MRHGVITVSNELYHIDNLEYEMMNWFDYWRAKVPEVAKTLDTADLLEYKKAAAFGGFHYLLTCRMSNLGSAPFGRGSASSSAARFALCVDCVIKSLISYLFVVASVLAAW